MLDLLPPLVVETLRDRYLAGVASAEHFFYQSRADEDSVTGALGQALAMRDPIAFQSGERTYVVSVKYRKVRGRGPNAPENRFGLDGVFQMQITDWHGLVVRQKALPFQSKINWHGKNKELANQAAKMEALGGGIVIDYTPNGYSAIPSRAVLAANGSRAQVDRFGVVRPLGQILGIDFLACTVGTVGVYYESDEELRPAELRLTEGHLISTSVQVVSPQAT